MDRTERATLEQRVAERDQFDEQARETCERCHRPLATAQEYAADCDQIAAAGDLGRSTTIPPERCWRLWHYEGMDECHQRAALIPTKAVKA